MTVWPAPYLPLSLGMSHDASSPFLSRTGSSHPRAFAFAVPSAYNAIPQLLVGLTSSEESGLSPWERLSQTMAPSPG